MLSHADRSRVEKLVAMLGSPFENERSTAAAFLTRMAAELKLTINELLAMAQAPSAPESPPQPTRQWRETGDLLDDLAQSINFQSVLSSWELGFAADVSGKYIASEQLSERQRYFAQKIVAKARRAALAGVEPDWGEVD